MIARLIRHWNWLQLRLAGAKINYRVQIHSSLFRGNAQEFTCKQGAYFSEGVKILIGSYLQKHGKLTIEEGFFANYYSIIDCHHSITIGKRVKIGPYCYITDFDHDIKSHDTIVNHEGVAKPVVIEDDVWIGAGVIVLKGVTIGKGAVVGAGSIVIKDVPAKSVVAGSPTRLLYLRSTLHEKQVD